MKPELDQNNLCNHPGCGMLVPCRTRAAAHMLETHGTIKCVNGHKKRVNALGYSLGDGTEWEPEGGGPAMFNLVCGCRSVKGPDMTGA